MKVVVLAAHPDDEVLGCGGTMYKHHLNGDKVTVIIVSDGYMEDYDDENFRNLKREHAKKSCEILGVDKVLFLGYKGARLDLVSNSEINGHISELIAKEVPDIVYTHHWGDLNRDHLVVFEASIVGCRPHTHNQKKVQHIYSYEVLSSSEWSGKVGEDFFTPTKYNILSKEIIEKKIEAFKYYETEQCKYPHPRSTESVYNLAKHRGFNINEEYAEAFAVVRSIEL